MEPTTTLKRSSATDLNFCILCQTEGGPLRSTSTYATETLLRALETRKKSRDIKNRSITDRLDSVFSSETNPALVWHKNCYAQFTDKNKLMRLQHQGQAQDSIPTCSSDSGQTQGLGVRRSSVNLVDWTLCIFCQDAESKEKLSLVMTFNTSSTILEASGLDHKLGLRLAGTSDLIAAEAKYHLSCYSSFKRKTAKVKDDLDNHADLPLIWLSSEITYAAEKGHVLCLGDIWNWYTALSEEANTVIPNSFLGHRSTFREKLQSLVGDTILFVKPHHGGPSQRETLLIPSKYTGNAIAQLQESAIDENLTVPIFEPEDIFLLLVHVALKLRRDLL